MRRIIKRLLKKYGYPPDKTIQAMTTVMRQAEKMAGIAYEEELSMSHGMAAEDESEEY